MIPNLFLVAYTCSSGILVVVGLFSKVALMVGYGFNHSFLSQQLTFFFETIIWDFFYIVNTLVATLEADFKLLAKHDHKIEKFCTQLSFVWAFRVVNNFFLILNFLEFAKKSLFDTFNHLIDDLVILALYECTVLFILPVVTGVISYFLFCNSGFDNFHPFLAFDLWFSVLMAFYLLGATVCEAFLLIMIKTRTVSKRENERDSSQSVLDRRSSANLNERIFQVSFARQKRVNTHSRHLPNYLAKVSAEEMKSTLDAMDNPQLPLDSGVANTYGFNPNPVPVERSVRFSLETNMPENVIEAEDNERNHEMRFTVGEDVMNFANPGPSNEQQQLAEFQKPEFEQVPASILGCGLVVLVMASQNLVAICILLLPNLGFDYETVEKFGSLLTVICNFLTLSSAVSKRLIYISTISLNGKAEFLK